METMIFYLFGIAFFVNCNKGIKHMTAAESLYTNDEHLQHRQEKAVQKCSLDVVQNDPSGTAYTKNLSNQYYESTDQNKPDSISFDGPYQTKRREAGKHTIMETDKYHKFGFPCDLNYYPTCNLNNNRDCNRNCTRPCNRNCVCLLPKVKVGQNYNNSPIIVNSTGGNSINISARVSQTIRRTSTSALPKPDEVTVKETTTFTVASSVVTVNTTITITTTIEVLKPDPLINVQTKTRDKALEESV